MEPRAEIGLDSSAIAPLHQNLHKQVGKRVLTRTAVGSVVVLSIEEGNGSKRVGGGIVLLHKQEEDIRN
jgi:hypothetical protein